MEQTPSRHRHRTPAPNQEPRIIIYIDQSNNSGNIVTGSGFRADLLAEIERLKKENARLMSITENMAERIRELRAGQAAPRDTKQKAGR